MLNKSLVLAALLMVSGLAHASSISMTLGEETALPECGGTIEVKTNAAADQVDLVLRNVANCSNFDIQSTNGYIDGYQGKKIPGANGDRTGSFTLPKSVMADGLNYVTVSLHSDSGKTEDDVTVRFVDGQSSTGTVSSY